MKYINHARELLILSGLVSWVEPTEQYAEWTKHTTLISKINGKVVGFCMVDYLGCIYSLVVHPEYRNKGVGKRLIMRCLRNHGATHLFCEDHLVPYYQKLGFTLNLTSSKTMNNKMEYNGRIA